MKKNDNYLDKIFVHNPRFEFKENELGNVTIFVENKGVFNRIAQLLLNKPKVSQVHLEEFGNFIWKQIDGTNSVFDISVLVHDKFGEKAEPLLPRLVQYFKMLEGNSFVVSI